MTRTGPVTLHDPVRRRMSVGLAVSLLVHALVLSLQFGAAQLGVPSLMPPLTVKLVQAPEPPPSLPEPVPAPPEPSAAAPLPSPARGLQVLAAPPNPSRRISQPKSRKSRPVRRVITQDVVDKPFAMPVPEPDEAASKTLDRTEAQEGADDLAAREADGALKREQDQKDEARQREADRLAAEDVAKRAAVAAEEALKREADMAVEEARQRETDRLAEEERKRAAERVAAEAKTREAERLAAEEARKRESDRLAEEARRRETDRLAEETRKREADRLAEEARKREADRLTEETRRREAVRLDEEARKREADRLAEEARKREADRLAEEARKREADRLAEEARRREAERLAEEARRREADRLAAEDARRREAQRAAEARDRQAAAAPGTIGAGSGAGGAGNVPAPRSGSLPSGADLASRARDAVRGLDLLGRPPRALEERTGGQRRVTAGRAIRDIPLRMYVESWKAKIERNGNLNYSSVRRVRIDPVVVVAIRADGSVEEISFVRSSGRTEVDEAVRRIVRLNARYSVFPPNIAANYDVIEIRRVWSFDDELRLIEEVD